MARHSRLVGARRRVAAALAAATVVAWCRRGSAFCGGRSLRRATPADSISRLGGQSSGGERSSLARVAPLQASGSGDPPAGEPVDDGTSVELFRAQLMRNFDGDETIGSTTDDVKWASCISADDTKPGDLLLANPANFVSVAARAGAGEMGTVGGLSGFALKAMSFLGMGDQGITRDLPQRDRGRLMPVVLVLRRNEDGSGEGVSLTTRTGMLLGDYDLFSEFMIRPLHDGGPEKAGLLWVHPYPQVDNSKRLADSELYVAGDKQSAQEWVSEGQGSSLRFRFFVNRVRWGPGELTKELNNGGWLPVRCSSEFVLDEGGELGTKPLWVDVAEAAGGRVEEAGREADLL